METKQKYERALRVSARRERNPGVPLDLDWVRAVRVNRSAVERRAATIPTRRTVKKEWQAAWLLRAVTCVDLTTLQGDDTPSNVLRLCAKAQHPVRQDLVEALGATELGIVVGAVCVYHRYVPTALAALAGSGIPRSEEHTSELQSQSNLVCRLLLEKKKKKILNTTLLDIDP